MKSFPDAMALVRHSANMLVWRLIPAMYSRRRQATTIAIATLALSLVGRAQSDLPKIVAEYWDWHERAKPLPADGDPIAWFEAKLRAGGLSADAAAAKIEELRRGLIEEEGQFYDTIYSKAPTFNTKPNKLLVDAIKGAPGRALDVGMGQGRNAVFLAQQGWDVTGFDPSAVGLEKAHQKAAEVGVTIKTARVGAQYFDFGRERWDLIAIIYPIEKVSVYRVRDSLKPGGLVVIEAPHQETVVRPWHYDSNELLEIFRGFRILRYEDVQAPNDWEPLKEARLVRLVAEKPR